MKNLYHLPLVNLTSENKAPFFAFFSVVEPNVDPSPSFDIESNKQDKDKEVDNPVIKKKPETDNSGEEESPHPDTNN